MDDSVSEDPGMDDSVSEDPGMDDSVSEDMQSHEVSKQAER